MADVVVLGQVGRDLVLRTAALPEVGGSATVAEGRELLGGRGGNPAVGPAQPGGPGAPWSPRCSGCPGARWSSSTAHRRTTPPATRSWLGPTSSAWTPRRRGCS